MVSPTFSFPLCVFVFFECTHVHVCLWVAGCTHMCAHIHVGTRSQCQASSFTSFHFVCFRIGLSLNLELTNPARWWASKPQGSPWLPSPLRAGITGVHCQTLSPNSGPHIHAASLLVADSSPQSPTLLPELLTTALGGRWYSYSSLHACRNWGAKRWVFLPEVPQLKVRLRI